MKATHRLVLSALITLLFSYLPACSGPKSENQVTDAVQCLPRAQLDSHQGYLDELTRHYCADLFTDLAPEPPEGVDALVAISSSYKALPNYLQYPDIDPMMGNTRRLSLIASCMHKRCLAASKNQALLCRGSTDQACTSPKATFLVDALISDISQACKPNPYTLRRVTTKLANIFQKRENKGLTSCASKTTTEQPDLAIMLGSDIDNCSLKRPDCPTDQTCIQGNRGNRCVPTEHAAHFRPNRAPAEQVPSSTCGNGTLESAEACDSGDKNGQPVFGAWCTTACTWAHCGDSVLDAGEACECDLAYQSMFYEKPKLKQSFGSLGNCPGRFSITRGQEKALGFQCRACQLVHPRHPREWRTNSHYLPEKDLTKPLANPIPEK